MFIFLYIKKKSRFSLNKESLDFSMSCQLQASGLALVFPSAKKKCSLFYYVAQRQIEYLPGKLQVLTCLSTSVFNLQL